MDLQPGVRRRAGRGLDGVGLGRADVGLLDRELQVRVRDASVFGDGSGLERIRGRRDIGDAGKLLDGLRDRGLAFPGVQRLTARGGEDDPAGRGVRVGVRNGALDELDGLLRLGARDLEFVRERPLERSGQAPQHDEGEYPSAQYEASTTYREVSETLQQAGHLGELRESRSDRDRLYHRIGRLSSDRTRDVRIASAWCGACRAAAAPAAARRREPAGRRAAPRRCAATAPGAHARRRTPRPRPGRATAT